MTNKKITKVKVVDASSNETLVEYPIEDLEKAYQYAAHLEEMGLDIKVLAPSVTQTLCDSLGIEHDALEEYENSVVAEIDDHDGSCCAKPATFTHKAPDTVQ